MESEDQSIDPRIRGIADNKAILLEALDVNPVLLTELSAEEILDESTKQHITSNKKYGTNERFIDWLKTGSPQTIDIVLQKLRDDKQDHVANLIDGNEGERPLSAKAKQQIKKLTRWLTENMTTDNGLIDELLSRKAISSRDSEDIRGKPTEYERVIELIYVILRRSDRTLKMFLKALVASNQNHVAQIVEKDEMIELCLPSTGTCKTAERNLQDSPKLDNDEELQHKMKSISSHNFAIAVIKVTSAIIIYVLCEDGVERKLLEELFQRSQHRAAILEELIKSSTSNTRSRSLLESKVLQLIQDILPNVDHSEIVLQNGIYYGCKSELDMVSESRSSSLEKSSLQPKSMTSERSLILSEQSHVVRSEKVVCDFANQNQNEKSLRAKIDQDAYSEENLFKMEGTKTTDKTESKDIDYNKSKESSKVEQEQRENHVGLAVDDEAEKNTDPAILELQLKLKLARKELERKISEVACLHERLSKLEEEKDDIRKDLAEILELNAGDRHSVIVDLNRRVREVEKKKEQLSKALKEALFALHQTEEKYRDLQERGCKHSHDLSDASLLGIMKEMNNDANKCAAWSELKKRFVFATEMYVNGKNFIPMLLLMLRNTKSRKEAIGTMAMVYLLYLQPLLLHLPIGMPDAISSFFFTNISVVFWGSIVLFFLSDLILDRKNLCKKTVSIVAFGLLAYLSSDGYGPGIGVGRYCEEDKCVYQLRWEYLSKNMRMGEEALEQIPDHYYDGDGGLFTSPGVFALWNKYTSHRWDKEIREYTQNGRFIRKIYAKPILGALPFHLLTVFRLNTGFFSAGHGSIFYDDPMLKLCMLDTNGNIIKSFGGQFGSSKGVPMVLDADREGCLVVADQMSRKTMTLCSSEEHMNRLKDKVNERNNLSEMCLHSFGHI